MAGISKDISANQKPQTNRSWLKWSIYFSNFVRLEVEYVCAHLKIMYRVCWHVKPVNSNGNFIGPNGLFRECCLYCIEQIAPKQVKNHRAPVMPSDLWQLNLKSCITLSRYRASYIFLCGYTIDTVDVKKEIFAKGGVN